MDIKNELINSIRGSKHILEVANNVAVRVPRTGEIIYLKQRPCHEVPVSQYSMYQTPNDSRFHNYSELFQKSILLDVSMFNIRGRELLKSL